MIWFAIVALVAFWIGGAVGFVSAAIIAATPPERRNGPAAAPRSPAAVPEEGSALWI